jgi:hypothetical protein
MLPHISVQSVAFPSHHSAPPRESSRCKGFAFIVLDSLELVDILSRSYPWDGPFPIYDIDQEAARFGMRALPKVSWDKLKAEYLTYQQRLLSQVAEEAAASEVLQEVERHVSPLEVDHNHSSEDAKAPPSAEKQNYSSWYPQDCLVFVRNIHPETNKTALRVLFSSPLSSAGGVDYVDFNKGIDSVSLHFPLCCHAVPVRSSHHQCHLRLASPLATAQLASHFTSHSTAQGDALDQVGSAPTKDRPRIELEVVQGKREELYWEKVPEKVRNAAVERLRVMKDGEILEEEEIGKKRKRRKKG